MSGISSKALAFGGSANNFKYNSKEQQAKEFSDGTGVEWLDYGARMYDNQIGRWITMDPLFENVVNYNPYSYCIDNPIRFVDKDGRYFSLEDNQTINAQIEKLKNKIKSQEETLAKINSTGGSVGLEKVSEALKNSNKELTNAISELESLQSSDQLYELDLTTSDKDHETTYNKDRNSVVIYYIDDNTFFHEAKHVFQYDKGMLNFHMDGTEGVLYDINDEVEAYQRQYAWNQLSVEGLSDISSVNASWVQGLQKNGKYIYANIPTENLSCTTTMRDVIVAWNKAAGRPPDTNTDMTFSHISPTTWNINIMDSSIIFYLFSTNNGIQTYKSHF